MKPLFHGTESKTSQDEKTTHQSLMKIDAKILNVSKQSPAAYKKNYLPQPPGNFLMNARLIQHTVISDTLH